MAIVSVVSRMDNVLNAVIHQFLNLYELVRNQYNFKILVPGGGWQVIKEAFFTSRFFFQDPNNMESECLSRRVAQLYE